jgi:hypothetical protein
LNDTIAPDGTRHVVNITFACEAIGGAVTDHPRDPRVEAVDLMAVGRLPSLDLRPPMAEHIAAHVNDPDRVTEYVGSLYVAD